MSRPVRLLVGLVLIGWLAIGFSAWRLWPVVRQLLDRSRPRTFYLPSQSMLPTLGVNDRIRSRLIAAGALRRGMVLVVHGPDSVRVARLVGVAGDFVAFRAGTVFVNGLAVPQRELGAGPLLDGTPTRLLAERLPGERGQHRILDAGSSIGDDQGPTRVPAGMLFLLGDDRDRAADSRFPPAESGLGVIPVGAVIGVVDRVLWRAGFHGLGEPVDAL